MHARRLWKLELARSFCHATDRHHQFSPSLEVALPHPLAKLAHALRVSPPRGGGGGGAGQAGAA